jgi:hypothetical protein
MTPGARATVLGIGALGLALVFIAAPVARAQDTLAGPIEFSLRVIYATKAPGVIEADCKSLQARLPMKFGAMHLLGSQEFELVLGQVEHFPLPGGRKVRMMPVSVVGDHLHVHFAMPGRVSARLQMTSGRPMIIGGDKHDKGQLIVEITPTYRILGGPIDPPYRGGIPQVQRVRGEKR